MLIWTVVTQDKQYQALELNQLIHYNYLLFVYSWCCKCSYGVFSYSGAPGIPGIMEHFKQCATLVLIQWNHALHSSANLLQTWLFCVPAILEFLSDRKISSILSEKVSEISGTFSIEKDDIRQSNFRAPYIYASWCLGLWSYILDVCSTTL